MEVSKLDPRIASLLLSLKEKPASQTVEYGSISREDMLIFNSLEEIKALGITTLRNMQNIEAVSLPSGMDVLPESFFYGCSNLKYAQLPDRMKEIGKYAFFGCEDLKSLRFPIRTEIIGDFAFSECKKLAVADIPATVTDIGCAAFRGCSSLLEVDFPAASRLQHIGSHCFQGCEMLTSLSLPAGIEALSESVICGCRHMREFRVPRGVKEIGKNTFFGSSLANIYMSSDDILLHPGSLNGLEQTDIYVNWRKVEFRIIEQDMKSGDL